MKNPTTNNRECIPPTANSSRPNLRGRALRVARGLLAVYLIIMLGMVFLETHLLYPIPPLSRGNWKPTAFEYEDVHFESADGTKLNAWFFPNPNTKRAILYCHGNGEDVAADGEFYAHLSHSRVLNANVLIFDYRGYGHSEGSPTEAGCIANGAAAQKWLANRVGIQPNEVILLGRSLGSAVATALAADNGCRALILENSMPSIVSVAAQHYPWLPVKWIMRNRYDNLERIKRYTGPMWQSHGTADTLIPIASARTLFDASPSENKRWIEYPNLEHDDPRPREYYDELAAFLTTLDDSSPNLQPASK